MKVHQVEPPAEADLLATRALVVYAPQHESSRADVFGASRGESAVFATVHEILLLPGQRPELMPGRPIDRAALDDIGRMLAGVEGSRVRRMLPERVLYTDVARLVWWRPSGVGEIFFRTGRKDFDEAMAGARVIHPPLLFVATPGQLCVWALGRDARPAEGDGLFQAPYGNVYDSGKMCQGNVRLPDSLLPSDLQAWEESFFGTNFTHSAGGIKLTSFPGGHDALWKSLRQGVEEPEDAAPVEAFPLEALIPVGARSPRTVLEAIQGKGEPS